jgi:hypothetical protein
MRPKLKPDVYWVPSNDGVAFVHAGGSMQIRGRSALALMDRLAPHLDGSMSLDDLLAGLPEGKQEMVGVLVRALRGAGMVKDSGLDRPHDLTDDELAAYDAEISYVDYYLDSAARRFQTYRETPVVCVGSGLTLTALTYACLRSGVRATTVYVAGGETDRERLAGYDRDGAQQLSVRSLGDLHDVVHGAGIVLHVDDRPAPERAFALDRLCRDHGVPLVQAVMSGDEAWVGPVSLPGRPGWASAWHRRAANLAVPPAGEQPSAYLAGPTAAIVANRVSFLAMRHLTGVAAADPGAADPAGQDRDAVSRVDLETLQTSEHRYHAHPAAADAGPELESEFVDRYAAFLAATADLGAAFSPVAAGLFDPALGVFAELDEERMPQLPLHVSRSAVADPFGLLDSRDGPVLVTGSGLDFSGSRTAAAVTALGAYAALAVDRRRLTDAGRAYAHNLLLDKPELIDAAVVYPALAQAGSPASAFRPPLGLGSGPDAAAALTRGLLDHCVALTAESAPQRPAVRVTGLPLDERGRRYTEILAAARLTVEVFDVTGPLGVPVYAFRCDDRTVAYAAGSEPEAGLAQVLLAHQGATPAAEVPQLAPTDGPARAAEPVAAASWPELAEALHREGYQVHAVPAGHDPVVTRVLPTLVQVAVHV